MRKHIDINIKRQILKEFQGGAPVIELVKKYNLPYGHVRRYAHGVYMKNFNIGNKKYYANENYFDTIDTPEKAYWLGFLYADGCVQKKKTSHVVYLGLKSSDRPHIELFNKCLDSSYKVRDGLSRQTYKGKKQIRKYSSLTISSEKLFNGLIKHGCIPRKSLVLTYPSFLEAGLTPHFIRGYFDGDGCIQKVKAQENGFSVTIAGTEMFLEGVQKYLSQCSIKSYLHPRRRIFCLISNRREDILKMRNVFYGQPGPYLKRKKDLFDLAEPIKPRLRNEIGNKFIKRPLTSELVSTKI